ncbi:hypothetical protein FLM9_313 [Candidatus Synechococcus spongiarum]|uniref:Uncharacterized protein n=1 Tax=Candidatus Synechococcus spongiarum TaxID=431041 RepID=A0A164ZQ38_9SYNE|nr:hypothetical protein FLM9_313 [Candidatus Synechococcus spongiarum]
MNDLCEIFYGWCQNYADKHSPAQETGSAKADAEIVELRFTATVRNRS